MGETSKIAEEKREIDKDEAEILEPSLTLYGTAASTFFSDSLLWYFLFPYAAVLQIGFAEMGFIRSARNLFTNVLQIGWGGLCEKFGKRVFVLAGYLLSGITVVALLLFNSPFQILILVILQSIFWSLAIPAWNALLGDYTKRSTRGKVMGRIMSVSRFYGVGATLLVALIAIWTPNELKPSSFVTPFLLSAAASIAAGVLVIFVKERKVRTLSLRIRDVFSPMHDKNFRVFLIVEGFFWFAMAFAWPLFPYVTVDIVQATLWQIALISSVSGLIVSFTQPKFGSLADKIGRKPLIAASAASFFLFPLFYAFARDWIHLAAIHAILGLAMACFSVSSTSYILDSAPIGRRGTYTGAYNLVFGFASFLGSFAGGTFADYLSAANGIEQVVFIGLTTSTVMRLISSIGFMKIRETLPKRKS